MPPLSLALPLILGLASALAPSPARAAGPDEDACHDGDAAACMRLARAWTGAGRPVDIAAAQSAYKKACDLGETQGCAGAEGISRYLGRHVELHFLPSDGRLWLLYGPVSVAEGQEPTAPGEDVSLAVKQRLGAAETCYRNAFQSNPRLAGMLDVSLVVDGGRVVEQILHQSSLASPEAAACVVHELGQVSLPESFAAGELFLRLRAEPAPDSRHQAPVLQDHLADGAQSTVGGPDIDLDDPAEARRLGIALTVAARRALQGERCVLDAVKAGDWGPRTLEVAGQLAPSGRLEGVSVQTPEGETPPVATCLQEVLDDLAVGATGLPTPVGAKLTVGYAPAWTKTVVPR